jgi:hypothetical protein
VEGSRVAKFGIVSLCLPGRLGISTKNVSENRLPSLDVNPAPSECEAELLLHSMAAFGPCS